MNYYLGIDGGGSNTRIALVDEENKLCVHTKLQRNSNPTSTGFDYLKQTLEVIKDQLVDYTPAIKSIVINLAGVGAQQQLKKTKLIVKSVFQEVQRVAVYHDAFGSLLANSSQEASILVICGTGSVMVGKNRIGDFYRAGGWGYLLGDEGSGFWLVKKLFQEYLAYHDGIREDDPSFEIFREQFEREPRDSLYRFYESHHRRDTAALSALFLDRGYPLAQRIVSEGIIVVKKCLNSMKLKIKDELQHIIYMGGMFDSDYFLNTFKKLLSDQIPLKKGKTDIEIELAKHGKEKDWSDQ